MSDSLMCTNLNNTTSPLASFEPENTEPLLCALPGQPEGRAANLALSSTQPQQGTEHLMGARQAPNATASFVANRQTPSTNAPSTSSTAEPATGTLTPFHTDAGVTPSGDAVYGEFALLSGSGRTSHTQVGTVNGQVGGQNEVTASVASMTAETLDGAGSLSAELLTASATLGSYNPDGSLGVNIGAEASYATATYTHEFAGGSSVTLGGQVGTGAGASAGVRDRDGDGNPELCARVGVGPVTVGACIEPASIVEGFHQVGQWFSGR